MAKTLLRVEKLKIHYPSRLGLVRAVDGVSFLVRPGETYGIIGESGCGKSTLGRAVAGLIKPTSGYIVLAGKGVPGTTSRMERARDVQMIFQHSGASLDPRYTVGRTIEEPLMVHRMGDAEERRARTLELMADVGLGPELMDRYPHALSGGQRQRVGVARALALSPRMVVCDEPVSALDVSIQAQILTLMTDLQRKYGLTYLFISHNLSVVRLVCDRVAVMYLGHIVESGTRRDIFDATAHPYTLALMSAIPDPDPDVPDAAQVLEGDVPSPVKPPGGCVFHTRCPRRQEVCSREVPPLREVTPGHLAACHLVGGDTLD